MSIRPIDLTLWSGVDIDAGDSTDVEQSVDLQAKLAPLGLALDVLPFLRDAFFLLNLATKADTPQMTLDSLSLSESGSLWIINEYMSRYYTEAGTYKIPTLGPWAASFRYFRFDATANQLSGTHKWTGCSLRLLANIHFDRQS